ncbi:alanine racemase [Mycobacterium sp. C31M]
MPAIPWTELEQEPIDHRFKGFLFDPPVTIADLAGLHLADPSVRRPLLLLRESALAHNLVAMRDFCVRHHAALMPHAKTTMSPQLVARQLDAGAAGITVATVAQARVIRRYADAEVIIANQVTHPGDLAWIAENSPGITTLVDSVATVEQMSRHLSAPLPVLIEVGYDGGRAGGRTLDTVVAVAEAVRATSYLTAVGLEGFEGLMPRGQVACYLDRVRAAYITLRERNLLADNAVLSFGGSKFFDVIVEALDTDWRRAHGAELILRSGCYLTHDHGTYHELAPPGMLQPALELRADIVATPENGLAIANFGKRDAASDAGFPIVLSTPEATVTAMDDQHAYIRGSFTVGDEVVLGISHPCTAFDKWSLIPVVDDDDRIITAVRTFF